MMVEWASEPLRLPSSSMARAASALLAAVIAKAMRISFEWRRGLRLPRWSIFQTLDRFNHLRLDKFSILINTCEVLIALIKAAAVGPQRVRILPVTICPFGNSRARAEPPVSSALDVLQRPLAIFRVMPRSFMSNSIFLTAVSGTRSF